MRKRSRLLLSGDGAIDCPEVVWLHISDRLPNIEVPPVVLDRALLNRRPDPKPWGQAADAWYARFKGAQWIWTTSKFYQPNTTRREELTVRRSFSLPAGAANARIHVIACAVGGLTMYFDGEIVGRPKEEPQGADNFYAEFERDEKVDTKKPDHVWEFCISRTVSRFSDKKKLPVGGLIYCLEVTWEEETKADVVKRFIDAWFGAVTSRFFRIFGLLGFIGFLALALWPQVEPTTRGICGVVAAGFLGAWLSPLIRIETERERRKGKQE